MLTLTLEQLGINSLTDADNLTSNYHKNVLFSKDNNKPIILTKYGKALETKRDIQNAIILNDIQPKEAKPYLALNLASRILIFALFIILTSFVNIIATDYALQGLANNQYELYYLAPLAPAVMLGISLVLFKAFFVNKNFTKVATEASTGENFKIPNVTLLLPTDATMSFADQARATKSINKEVYDAIMFNQPALTFERQELITMILEILLNEKNHDYETYSQNLNDIAILNHDLICKHLELPRFLRPMPKKLAKHAVFDSV